MTDITTEADRLHDELADHTDVTVEDITDRLRTLVDEYKVPIDEARRSVKNHYLDDAGVDPNTINTGQNEHVSINEIDQPDEWIDIIAKVVELWEPRADSIAQVGLLGDETGTIKFTKWAKSDLPELEENTVYRLENVVTDEYQGRFSVKLNRTTTIEEQPGDLEVGTNEIEVTGALVDIQSGSGLIKRCPTEDCTRVLQNGRCAEHGEVDGEFDLRIKGILDDGEHVYELLFNEQTTTELTEITLDEAKTMAMDALDTAVVADEMREKTLGRYYRVTGPKFNRYILANTVTEVNDPIDPDSILIKARSTP